MGGGTDGEVIAINPVSAKVVEGNGVDHGDDCKPEEIDVMCVFGGYKRGFGLHRDNADTAIFVLDGEKNFVVSEVETVNNHRYSLSRGQYLMWRSQEWHSNDNPDLQWSFTMNFVIGPAATRHVADGTPISYTHNKTQ